MNTDLYAVSGTSPTEPQQTDCPANTPLKSGSPCPICQSEVKHRHKRNGAGPFQIDEENLKPVELREPVTPAWSHFHGDGDRVIDWWFDEKHKRKPTDVEHRGKYVRGIGTPGAAIIEPQLVASVTGDKPIPRTTPQSWALPTDQPRFTIHYPENFYPETVKHYDKNLAAREGLKDAKLRVQLEDEYRGSDLSKPFDFTSTVPIAQLGWKLRPWVRSQKHHDIDPNIRRLRTMGRYKTLVAGDYNSTEESYGESGDSSGVNAPISAHKTGKYYGGDADHPENGSNSTGWAGYVDMRRIQYRELLFDKECERVLEAGAEPYSVVGTSEPADIQLERDRPEHPRPFIRQPMCPKYSSLPKAYCSHCWGTLDGTFDADPRKPIDEEPISDTEPDVFESEETDEEPIDEEPILPDESDDDDEPEVEDEAIEAIKSTEQDKPFEFVKRPYELDDPTPIDDEPDDEPDKNSRSGFGYAGIDNLLKHKSEKPWRGRTPWWQSVPHEARTKEQWEKMKLPYQLPPPCWPNSHMLAPVYGYGHFVKFRPQLRDPHVSVAGERLIWSQVEELCRRDGLIWDEHWDERVKPRIERRKSTHGGVYRVIVGGRRKRQTHEYGRSILNPDTAYKNKTYTYIDPNPILRTTGAAAEKEKEQHQENAEALDQMRNGKILILTSPVPEEELLAILTGKKSHAEVLVDNPGVNEGQLRKYLHDLRKKAKQKTDDPHDRKRWARALKDSNVDSDEPGIFALAHFPRSVDRVYKIAEPSDTKEAIWTKFHNVVLTLAAEKFNKNRKPESDADLLKLYNRYAWGLLQFRWRTHSRVPPTADSRKSTLSKVLVFSETYGSYLSDKDMQGLRALISLKIV